MYSEAKMLAYAKWHEILTETDILMDAEERYEELLKLADEYQCRGIIDRSERNTLIEIATAAYSRSVADLTRQALSLSDALFIAYRRQPWLTDCSPPASSAAQVSA